MMGGAKKIMAKGRELQAQGKYLESVEILNKLVFAEPRNQAARDLLADAYEQLGYQKESPSLRNSLLQGAYELRSGMPTGTAPSTGSADVIRSMPTGFWLDFLGISMDPKRAEGLAFTINLVLPDIGEKYLIELSNATLTNIEGVQAAKPDLTVTMNRADLNRVMLGLTTFDQLSQDGKARFDGDRTAIYKLRDLMVTFTPDFEFIPGSAPERRQVPPGRPFALPDPAPSILAE
jgi:alkyl sulfatase BDS1-like metallo-beta-lactamase superfamily hydrolase